MLRRTPPPVARQQHASAPQIRRGLAIARLHCGFVLREKPQRAILPKPIHRRERLRLRPRQLHPAARRPIILQPPDDVRLMHQIVGPLEFHRIVRRRDVIPVGRAPAQRRGGYRRLRKGVQARAEQLHRVRRNKLFLLMNEARQRPNEHGRRIDAQISRLRVVRTVIEIAAAQTLDPHILAPALAHLPHQLDDLAALRDRPKFLQRQGVEQALHRDGRGDRVGGVLRPFIPRMRQTPAWQGIRREPAVVHEPARGETDAAFRLVIRLRPPPQRLGGQDQSVGHWLIRDVPLGTAPIRATPLMGLRKLFEQLAIRSRETHQRLGALRRQRRCRNHRREDQPDCECPSPADDFVRAPCSACHRRRGAMGGCRKAVEAGHARKRNLGPGRLSGFEQQSFILPECGSHDCITGLGKAQEADASGNRSGTGLLPRWVSYCAGDQPC